jgi:hypothetical protein
MKGNFNIFEKQGQKGPFTCREKLIFLMGKFFEILKMDKKNVQK